MLAQTWYFPRTPCRHFPDPPPLHPHLQSPTSSTISNSHTSASYSLPSILSFTPLLTHFTSPNFNSSSVTYFYWTSISPWTSTIFTTQLTTHKLTHYQQATLSLYKPYSHSIFLRQSPPAWTCHLTTSSRPPPLAADSPPSCRNKTQFPKVVCERSWWRSG